MRRRAVGFDGFGCTQTVWLCRELPNTFTSRTSLAAVKANWLNEPSSPAPSLSSILIRKKRSSGVWLATYVANARWMLSGLKVCGAPAMTPPISAKYGLAFRIPVLLQSASNDVTGVYRSQRPRMSGFCVTRLNGNLTSR